MTDNLVKRLRGWASDIREGSTTIWAMDQDLNEATNRIEELEAENARLETEAKLQAEEIDKTRRRADKWESMVRDCEEYLKPGETPAERIQREINDCLALIKLLEKKQRRIEELEAENARLREAGRFLIERLMEFELSDNAKDMCREYMGHVEPAAERLNLLLESSKLATKVPT